jgi:hypothetical protein
MRQIKLTMREGAPDLYGGQRGEHRMAELVIPLPRARLPEINSCIAIFSCDNELVLSPLIVFGDSGEFYMRGNKVYITLWQRLTQCRALRVQLECYGGADGTDFIDRTRISEPILFQKSIIDSLEGIAEVPDQPGAIAQLLAAMHRHGNLTVIEELGDLAHELTYRGEPVISEPLTNMEINDLINQALAAVGGR